MAEKRKGFLSRSGFANPRDLAIFGIGCIGITPEIVDLFRGRPVNISALMFFGGFLGAPYLINLQSGGKE